MNVFVAAREWWAVPVPKPADYAAEPATLPVVPGAVVDRWYEAAREFRDASAALAIAGGWSMGDQRLGWEDDTEPLHEVEYGVSNFYLRGAPTDPPLALARCSCGWEWTGPSERESRRQGADHLDRSSSGEQPPPSHHPGSSPDEGGGTVDG